MIEQHKYRCPCCGFYTLSEQPPGTYAVCPVCFWEDDLVQFHDPTYDGGANPVSLVEARKNFLMFGAIMKEHKEHVRTPREDEIPPASGA